MCCAEFIVKYVLIIVNLIIAIAGIVIIGLGITVLVQLRDLQEILPVNIVPISIIVLGCVIFLIAFLACCGSIKEIRCMLISYAVLMGILAAIKMYLAVVIFRQLDNIQDTLGRWISDAFNNNNLRAVFNVMEALFRCCGTTGPSSYQLISEDLPPTCCANPIDNQCIATNAFRGCNDMVGSYFDTFGEAIASVLIVIIAIELVATIFALFLSNSIRNKARKERY